MTARRMATPLAWPHHVPNLSIDDRPGLEVVMEADPRIGERLVGLEVSRAQWRHIALLEFGICLALLWAVAGGR